MDNDGHDKGDAFAASWLQKNFATRFANPQFLKETLVVITFDESGKSPGNHIFTVLLGDSVIPGSTSSQSMNNVGLLRTVEDEFNLGTLKRLDSSASALQGIWK
jgi:phosphatidylinositol-3-phosphatase